MPETTGETTNSQASMQHPGRYFAEKVQKRREDRRDRETHAQTSKSSDTANENVRSHEDASMKLNQGREINTLGSTIKNKVYREFIDRTEKKERPNEIYPTEGARKLGVALKITTIGENEAPLKFQKPGEKDPDKYDPLMVTVVDNEGKQEQLKICSIQGKNEDELICLVENADGSQRYSRTLKRADVENAQLIAERVSIAGYLSGNRGKVFDLWIQGAKDPNIDPLEGMASSQINEIIKGAADETNWPTTDTVRNFRNKFWPRPRTDEPEALATWQQFDTLLLGHNIIDENILAGLMQIPGIKTESTLELRRAAQQLENKIENCKYNSDFKGAQKAARELGQTNRLLERIENAGEDMESVHEFFEKFRRGEIPEEAHKLFAAINSGDEKTIVEALGADIADDPNGTEEEKAVEELWKKERRKNGFFLLLALAGMTLVGSEKLIQQAAG